MTKKHQSTKSGPPGAAGRSKHGKAHVRNLTGLWIGLGIVIVAAAAFVLFRPQQSLPSEISAVEAYEKYEAGAFFLDVRSAEEWSLGHIPKSTLIPLDELPSRLNEVPRDQDVIVVCRSGARSKEGAAILREAGFRRVTCMTGGLQAWGAAGYPVEQ